MLKPPKLYEYVGAIHIHTKDSDGSKTHEEIIRIADKIHLDFLLFTDHMTLAHKGLENWHNKVLVLVGYEIHDPANINHYLAFGLDDVLHDGLEAPEYVREVKERGGFGIIAHPDEVRDREGIPPAFPWTAWEVNGYDGIEIWNHMSSWLEGVNKQNKLSYLFHPRSILGTPAPETLAKWDKVAEKRRVLGIGSLDAHAAEYHWGPIRLTIFPYKVQLQAIRTHVLLERPLPYSDFGTARSLLMNALSKAQVFISNYRWGNSRGFRFWCESKKQRAIVGGAVRFHPSIVFKVLSPEPGTIRFIKNGRVIATAEGTEAEFPVDGVGAYRVEILKGEKGWVYSNHIKILPAKYKSRKNGGKDKRTESESKRTSQKRRGKKRTQKKRDNRNRK
ncbi:histidinol-phosphatase [bacterium]|nr:MAG: histidinol-phosphatase [bacterium]